MDRQYLRSSSLARKFFEDFPDANNMPLQFMSNEHHQAYDQNVLPLLQLYNSNPDLANCYNAVQQIRSLVTKDNSVYDVSRAAAEYIQSPFALCILDSAAACSVTPQAASFCSALASCSPAAYRELLIEDVRRRLVANGLGDLTEGLTVQFDQHPAIAAAKPHPTDLDRLLIPNDLIYSRSSRATCLGAIMTKLQPAGTASASSLTAACAQHSSSSSSSDNKYLPAAVADPAAAAAAGIDADVDEPSILKRAAWRRQLSRFSSHYLSSILGKDGPGTVVLTGSIIADIISGNTHHQSHSSLSTSSLSAAATEASDGSSSSSSVCRLSFVGYTTADEAQQALHGCLTELITRWFMRHPTKILTPQGTTLRPLAVATQHHLLLLLPEQTQPLLPAAVQVDAAALAAAVNHGAFEGPAAAAAAGGAAAVQCTTFRDVMFSFDLALHPNMETLLLGATFEGNLAEDQPTVAAAAAECSGDGQTQMQFSNLGLVMLYAAANAMNAFAYDGDEVYGLPSAVRAMASGGTLIDAAAVQDVEMAIRHSKYNADTVNGSDQAAAAAAADGTSGFRISPQGFMSDPSLIRSVLDQDVQQQQQQQGIAGLLPEQQQPGVGANARQSTPAAAAAKGQGVGLSAVEQQRWVQQLRRDYGWVWSVIERSSKSQTAAGAAESDAQQQQQQLGLLLGHVAEVVADRWWKGPVMQGSVMYGSVTAEA